ncbi:hypothetical protein CDAR_387621 [Caerostris darwini]|uniref:Uncharacterized protein n=1 Tax=Caerostris darwini TaxID=1538125 RepID=A0AAV4TI82_9ARAC|nr:hypothetical protein CDAR_387621 [Caerostris darwini]
MERRSHLTPERSSVHWGWSAAAFDTEDGFRTIVSGLQCERAEEAKEEGVQDSWGMGKNIVCVVVQQPLVFPTEKPPSSRSIRKDSEGLHYFFPLYHCVQKVRPIFNADFLAFEKAAGDSALRDQMRPPRSWRDD